MSFGMRIEQRVADRRVRSTGSSSRPLTAIAIAFAIFCIFDYSPYGQGYVAAFLGDAQRWFQAYMRSFHLKM